MSDADMVEWIAISDAEKAVVSLSRDGKTIGDSKHVPPLGALALDSRGYKFSNEKVPLDNCGWDFDPDTWLMGDEEQFDKAALEHNNILAM